MPYVGEIRNEKMVFKTKKELESENEIYGIGRIIISKCFTVVKMGDSITPYNNLINILNNNNQKL